MLLAHRVIPMLLDIWLLALSPLFNDTVAPVIRQSAILCLRDSIKEEPSSESAPYRAEVNYEGRGIDETPYYFMGAVLLISVDKARLVSLFECLQMIRLIHTTNINRCLSASYKSRSLPTELIEYFSSCSDYLRWSIIYLFDFDIADMHFELVRQKEQTSRYTY